MHECWPALLSCLVAGGLSATLRLVAADILFLLRQVGIDGSVLAALGWPVAALLWLRLRIERAQRARWPVDRVLPAAPTGPSRAQDGDRAQGG